MLRREFEDLTIKQKDVNMFSLRVHAFPVMDLNMHTEPTVNFLLSIKPQGQLIEQQVLSIKTLATVAPVGTS